MNETEVAFLKIQLHQTVAQRLGVPGWDWRTPIELCPLILAADGRASNLLGVSIAALDAWYAASQSLQADPTSVDTATFVGLSDDRQSTRAALAAYCNSLP